MASQTQLVMPDLEPLWKEVEGAAFIAHNISAINDWGLDSCRGERADFSVDPRVDFTEDMVRAFVEYCFQALADCPEAARPHVHAMWLRGHVQLKLYPGGTVRVAVVDERDGALEAHLQGLWKYDEDDLEASGVWKKQLLQGAVARLYTGAEHPELAQRRATKVRGSRARPRPNPDLDVDAHVRDLVGMLKTPGWRIGRGLSEEEIRAFVERGAMASSMLPTPRKGISLEMWLRVPGSKIALAWADRTPFFTSAKDSLIVASSPGFIDARATTLTDEAAARLEASPHWTEDEVDIKTRRNRRFLFTPQLEEQDWHPDVLLPEDLVQNPGRGEDTSDAEVEEVWKHLKGQCKSYGRKNPFKKEEVRAFVEHVALAISKAGPFGPEVTASWTRKGVTLVRFTDSTVEAAVEGRSKSEQKNLATFAAPDGADLTGVNMTWWVRKGVREYPGADDDVLYAFKYPELEAQDWRPGELLPEDLINNPGDERGGVFALSPDAGHCLTERDAEACDWRVEPLRPKQPKVQNKRPWCDDDEQRVQTIIAAWGGTVEGAQTGIKAYPILVYSNLKLIDGYHRIEAWKRLGVPGPMTAVVGYPRKQPRRR